MSLDTVLAELKSKYRGTFEEIFTPPTQTERLSDPDVERWSGELGISRAAFYDRLASRLAGGFHCGEFPYAFCDWVMMDIHAVITCADEIRPKLFWNVFLAFDAGEYSHDDDDRSTDPSEKYTRPLIAKIIEDHKLDWH
jgi:hypothetical protein